MSKRVILEFPDESSASDFCAWFSDGGGEDSYFSGFEYADDVETPIVKCDYAKCFPAWGYDPEKDGPDRVIRFIPK